MSLEIGAKIVTDCQANCYRDRRGVIEEILYNRDGEPELYICKVNGIRGQLTFTEKELLTEEKAFALQNWLA